MGVPGLWEILRPAGKSRSLTHLAVEDGFKANPDGKRGLRVGIDASIWFYHANYGREGENPELRTLFFRCTRLMSMPFLPLFVFDGPKRPDIKRGKRVTGKNHWLVQGMQEIITAFGFEWRMAPGEAEAELAYLNRIGVIDAVLSDDVDTFLFGAKTVVRNKNVTLSGNNNHSLKNAAGEDDGNHAMVYRAEDILNHEDIQLTQGGLILIGILRGGDYDQAGLEGCGVALAHGLAKCGFGDSLLTAARSKSREELEKFLDVWREEIRAELRTNARGHLPRKSPKLSKSIPDDFPSIDVVLAYTNPVTSEAKGSGHKNAVVDWDKEPDLGKIAALCEMYFEWGIKEIIIKRFRTVLWPSAVLRILRRAAILKDRKAALLASRSSAAGGAGPVTPRKNGKERRAPPGTPSSMIAKHFSTMRLDSPRAQRATTLYEGDEEMDEDGERLIVKIHSSRRHPSTDHILEYRLEIAPAQLVRLCEAGVRGLRTALPPELTDSDDDGDDSGDDEDGGGKKGKRNKTKKAPPDPESHLRIWLPACMVEIVEPELVDEFEGIERMKAEKKAAKEARKAPRTGVAAEAKKGKKAATAVEEEEASGSEPLADEMGKLSKIPALPIPKQASKATKKANGHDAGRTAPPSKRMDEFFVAKKAAAATSTKGSEAKASTAARVANLFKDVPSSPQKRTPMSQSTVTSDDDDEVPRPPVISRVSSVATTESTTRSALPLSRPPPSRILSFLETNTTASNPGPSRPPVPTTASAKIRALRPFPMEFDALGDHQPHCSNTDPALAGPSSPSRMRSRSNVSSDSDVRSSTLQKSPRRSEQQSSPRRTPPEKTLSRARREEEEESSSESDFDDRRAPSPSPMKGRVPTRLGAPRASLGRARREEEEEESDCGPSISLARDHRVPSSKAPARLANGARKPPLPANLTIISISSGSEDECELPAKVAPLQQAKAQLGRPTPASSATTTTRPPSAPAVSRKPQRRIYNPDDIIDLT
ncbi:hypothetical protein PYCCODRAFT_1408690 [Trametes coccinea BRFM310]|uniref:XPG-I domain-containing protein n=1 Tax=Trametes coccinea (strain BRFM310) TaxID=1353009 RepID=A0A1Y2ITY5_TRAC3|nr:hypothetical protein PYCCODRAFT_1408690 [Trametes coccinea BRFM310]